MSDVLLGHSYYLRFDPKLWKAMQPYPPLGTLVAAAYLRDRAYDVAVFDATLVASTDAWSDALDEHTPSFAVLFEDNFNYLSKMCLLRMREAAFEMIAAAGRRGCTVLVCGSDATDRAGLYLHAGADFVLVGEGEETLGELLDQLSGRSNTFLPDIRGLAYLREGRRGDGRSAGEKGDRGPGGPLVRTPPRPVLKDLDVLPMPAWDLVDVGSYRELWRRRHGYFSLNLATSRGCPFHCNWCAKPIWGQRYNAATPERVVEQMAHLKARYEPDHFWFMDDMMGIKPGWTARFADLIEARGLKTPFKSLNRVDLLLRDGEIDALRRAGCEIVWSGVESGSQKILDAMDKGIRVEQVREATLRLHEAGIQVGYFLQFGYPGETREDIEMTFDLVRSCRPDRIGVSVSYPLPGTPFHEMVREQLGPKRNWEDSDDLAMMYRGPFTTAFYRRLHAVLHKEFRIRKAASRLRSSRPAAERLREGAALVYHAATLPLARVRMELAARRPHQGIAPVRGKLTRDLAAVPTPQTDGRHLHGS